MRSSKSRQRSKQNRPRTLGNIINRVFDSSGPEGKVRGTPQQIIEKYQLLARDAQLSNDRVAAENFLQHAEHYTRLLGEAQREMAAEQEARQQQMAQNGNQNGNGNGQNGNREYRDPNRPWRDDRALEPGSGDQPNLGVIYDPRGEDSGLIETPEARRDTPAAEQPRREDRREDRNRRADRPEFDRNRPQADARNNRGPRPPRPDQSSAASNVPETGAEPQPPVMPVAPAPQPKAETPVADAKPRRARAPRKPKDAEAAGGTEATSGPDDGPREAAE